MKTYRVEPNGDVYGVKGKILKTNKHANGYLSVCVDGKRRTVHRLVAETYIANPHNKPQVNHIDGDKTNNHKDNLEWCTQEENIRHDWKNGRRSAIRGDINSKTKIKESHIESIRQDTRSQYVIAKEYGVSQSLISMIKRGKRRIPISVQMK